MEEGRFSPAIFSLQVILKELIPTVGEAATAENPIIMVRLLDQLSTEGKIGVVEGFTRQIISASQDGELLGIGGGKTMFTAKRIKYIQLRVIQKGVQATGVAELSDQHGNSVRMIQTSKFVLSSDNM